MRSNEAQIGSYRTPVDRGFRVWVDTTFGGLVQNIRCDARHRNVCAYEEVNRGSSHGIGDLQRLTVTAAMPRERAREYVLQCIAADVLIALAFTITSGSFQGLISSTVTYVHTPKLVSIAIKRE